MRPVQPGIAAVKRGGEDHHIAVIRLRHHGHALDVLEIHRAR
jgi:hypothetical protein